MAQGTRIRAHLAVVAAPTEGTWTFTASVPTPSGGACLPTRGGSDTFGYRCPGQFGGSAQHRITNATFSFWRHRPAKRANVAVWYVGTTIQRSCASYATNAYGHRTCAHRISEVVEAPGGSRCAVLRVKPAV